VVDHHIAQFFRQGGAPLLGHRVVRTAEPDLEHIGGKRASLGQGDGAVVELAAQAARDFHRLDLALPADREGTADHLFDAAFNVIQ
jgi:hypothetical protein